MLLHHPMVAVVFGCGPIYFFFEIKISFGFQKKTATKARTMKKTTVALVK